MSVIIPFTSEIVYDLHDLLVDIYQDEDFPKKILPGVNYDGTVEYAVSVFVENSFPSNAHADVIDKTAFLLFHLNNGHPFNDGNKRTSLFAAYYALYWNGFILNIPEDTDVFLKNVANSLYSGYTVEDVSVWLRRNVTVRWIKPLLNPLLEGMYQLSRVVGADRCLWFFDLVFFNRAPSFLERDVKTANLKGEKN